MLRDSWVRSKLTAGPRSLIGPEAFQSKQAPAHCPLSRHGRVGAGGGGAGGGAFEVERAVLRKLCHVVLESGALIGPHGPVDAHFRRIPAVIGQISHPRVRRVRVRSSPNSLSRVTSAA